MFFPGKEKGVEGLHPITAVSYQIVNILGSLGYVFVSSPEIDVVKNNFDLLNIKEGHPARNCKDTFYFSDNFLLRTHTSNTQIRVLKKNYNRELKVVTVGKVYRRDEDDCTHTHQFNQAEAFLVEKGVVSFSTLKKTLVYFLENFFEEEEVVHRFRSSYFPFTTPSVEVDIRCFSCSGKGCLVCKNEGWIEVLGAGLIHPLVLKNCGFKEGFSGLAFGVGIERLIMIKYGVKDIRDFYNNDLRFLRQFNFLF